MGKTKQSSSKSLRLQAEEILKSRLPKTVLPQTEAETLKLIHELQLNQIELELRNKELLLAKEQDGKYESEQRYRYMFASNPQPMWIYDLETLSFLEVNDAAISHYGYSKEEFLSMTLKDIRPKEDIEALLQDVEKTRNTYNPAGQWRHLKKNGEIIFVDIISHTITFNDRKARHVMVTDITEPKRAKEELEKNRELQQSIIDGTDDAIYVKNTDGKYVLFNRAAELFTGKKAGEVLGKDDTFLFPAMEAAVVMQGDQKIINEGKTATYEEIVTTSDGTKSTFLSTKGPILDKKGNPIGLFGIAHDITELKQGQEMLREREYLFSASQRASHIGTWSWKVGATKVFWSEETYRIYGLNPEMGPPDFDFFFEIIHPDDRQKMQEWPTEVISGLHPSPVEFRVLRPDGIYRIIRTDGDVIEWVDGIPSRIAGTAYDITESKQAEEAINASKDKFRQVFETANVGKSITLPTGELNVNQAFCDMLGYSKEELQNKTWQEITPLDEIEIIQQKLTPLLKGTLNALRFEKRYLHKNGTHIWTDVSAVMQRDTEQKPLFFITTIVDITERKLAEEELKRSKQLLSETEKIGKVGGWEINIDTMDTIWTDEVYNIHEVELNAKQNVEKGISFYLPESRPIITNAVQRAIEFGESFDVELEIITAKGNRRNVHAIGKADLEHRRVYGFFQDVTERIQAEQKIREKDIQFRKLSANVPDLIFQFTRKPDGTYFVPVASKGIWNIFGCTPEDVLDDFGPIARVIYPEDAERVIRDIEYSAQHLTYFTCEFRVQISGREIQWIYSKSTPERLPDGSITWYGFNTDITHKKLAEETLKRSESEFRLLAEAMPQIVWITRPDGWNTYFNQQWVDYTGLTLEESYGHGWNKPFHPDDQQRAWEAWQNATKNNGIYSIESRLRRADGVYQWWLIRGVPILDVDGNILKWFGTCTNIHDLKEAEEAIRIHSERLQNLHQIDQAILKAIESPEAVVQTALQFMRSLLQCQRTSVGIFDLENKEVEVFAADVDGKTIVKSGSVLNEEVYGIIETLRQSKMEIVENMSILQSPSDMNKILQAEGILSSINVALVSELEMYGVLNVGWGNPRTFSTAEIEIVSEVASQITIAIEKARLLKETKRYATELEDRVSERTALLESSNKELEAFSYSVSHDLRAPLRHINGFVDLLNAKYQDLLPEKGKHYLDTISDSTKQMGNLIDDLLQFSKTSRQEMHLNTIDMNVLIQEVLDKIKTEVTGRTIDWVNSSLPTIYGDFNLLQLVWINLLSNAVKYTGLKEKAIIETGYTETNNEYVFFVRDNGVGFDMQYAHKLFGVFQRLHSSDEFEGTGIGLANVRRIVAKHGGRTWAEAEPGKGATFYFSLPKLGIEVNWKKGNNLENDLING